MSLPLPLAGNGLHIQRQTTITTTTPTKAMDRPIKHHCATFIYTLYNDGLKRHCFPNKTNRAGEVIMPEFRATNTSFQTSLGFYFIYISFCQVLQSGQTYTLLRGQYLQSLSCVLYTCIQQIQAHTRVHIDFFFIICDAEYKHIINPCICV